jgi:hypothetical protein
MKVDSKSRLPCKTAELLRSSIISSNVMERGTAENYGLMHARVRGVTEF